MNGFSLQRWNEIKRDESFLFDVDKNADLGDVFELKTWTIYIVQG